MKNIKQIIESIVLKIKETTKKEVKAPVTDTTVAKKPSNRSNTKKIRVVSLKVKIEEEPPKTAAEPEILETQQNPTQQDPEMIEKLEKKRQSDAKKVEQGKKNREEAEYLLQHTNPKKWFLITEREYDEGNEGAFFERIRKGIFKPPECSDGIVCLAVDKKQYLEGKLFITGRTPMIERNAINALKKQFGCHMKTYKEHLPGKCFNDHDYLDMGRMSDEEIKKVIEKAEKLISESLSKIAYPGEGSKLYIEEEDKCTMVC